MQACKTFNAYKQSGVYVFKYVQWNLIHDLNVTGPLSSSSISVRSSIAFCLILCSTMVHKSGMCRVSISQRNQKKRKKEIDPRKGNHISRRKRNKSQFNKKTEAAIFFLPLHPLETALEFGIY